MTAADEIIQPASPPWVWLLFSLPFTVPLWFDLAQAQSTGERAALLAFIVSYALSCALTVYRPVVWRVGTCLFVAAAATVLTAGFGYDAMYFAYPIVLTAILLPWHWAAAIGGGLSVAVATVAAVRNGGTPTEHMLLIGVALSGIGIGGFWRMAQQLKQANATIGALAVHEDRERLARDLHDAVGSTLTTITVKAALARRLLEDGRAEPALKEVRDVEMLGRQALTDVRAAVDANHAMPLAAALAEAGAALSAAGIDAELPAPVEGAPSVFSYVLREGVTNVIRHSGASLCRVRLSRTRVEIVDDGSGSTRGHGHGLSGLAERLRAVGGTLNTEPAPGGGFVLRAECPP